MTATLTPPRPAAPTDPTLRTLAIAADLLPTEIVEARRGRKVRRIVLSALTLFAVLLAGWYGLAAYQTSVARDNLANMEDSAGHLLRQQRDFAKVVSIQAESQAIRTQLSVLLANDLQWSRLLSALQRAEPRGVQLTGATAALTVPAKGAATASGPAQAQLPGAPGEKPIGTITVTGVGTSKTAVAAYVDALATVRGLANPMLGGATLQDEGVQFTVQVDISASALGGRYALTDKNGTDDNRGDN